jgi:hypothetical protein
MDQCCKAHVHLLLNACIELGGIVLLYSPDSAFGPIFNQDIHGR